MNELVIGPGDTSVSVQRQDVVVVRLPEIGSAGYQWRVSKIDPGLVVESDRAIPPGVAAPGAAGLHEFRLRADGIGAMRAEFELAQAWETVAEQRHAIIVTAR